MLLPASNRLIFGLASRLRYLSRLAHRRDQNGPRFDAICSASLINLHFKVHMSNESSKQEPSEVERVPRDEFNTDVLEEEYTISPFSQPLVPEKPIQGLDLSKKITKVKKSGSFTVDIFKGSYDQDFLTYPDPLETRKENQLIKDQAIMVQQLWPQVWDDQSQLKKYNFHKLYQLTVSEMMNIFESIGASSRRCIEFNITSSDDNVRQHVRLAQSIISLINRNCLTYWPIHKSNNEKLRKYLPQTDINIDPTSETHGYIPSIGFCWTEQADQLGSLPPQEWQTLNESSYKLGDICVIKGRKAQVLAENSEFFLVFFRDKFLSELSEANCPEDEPNPASDPFVGCCLVHKSDLKISPEYRDSSGFKFVDIDIDCMVSCDQIVFPPKRLDTTAVNIKALGQVASCSVCLGMLKEALKYTYRYLFEHKRGLLDCDIIERKLAEATSKIFAIESMVYFIGGMYDGLEDGFDAHMEAAILKIVTHEYSHEVLQILQQVSGSAMFMTSELQNQLNILDSYLDGHIYNRLYLSTMGVLWFARSNNMHLNKLRLAPWYPGYFLKSLIREYSERGNYLTINADILGNLHPSLNEAAQNLDFIVKRVKYATESLISKHGKDVTGAQSCLYRLAELSIDSFVLTTSCARASKSYCNGSRNCETDVAIVTSLSQQLLWKVDLYMMELTKIPFDLVDTHADIINELNLKHGGYYAESPFDPNI